HPRIMDAYNSGNGEYGKRLIRTSITWQVLLFVPIGAGLWWIGGPIISYLLPDVEIAIAPSLVIPLAAGGLLWQLALLVHKPLEVANRTTWMLGAIGISWIANVLIMLWALPEWGLSAAAFAYLAAGLA